jgi:predicted  nucleic acid-binding Zn-ribbon protein
MGRRLDGTGHLMSFDPASLGVAGAALVTAAATLARDRRRGKVDIDTALNTRIQIIIDSYQPIIREQKEYAADLMERLVRVTSERDALAIERDGLLRRVARLERQIEEQGADIERLKDGTVDGQS